MDGKKIDNKVKKLYEYKGELLTAKEVMEKLGCSHFPVYADVSNYLKKQGVRLAKVRVVEIYRYGKLVDRGTSARALARKYHYGRSYFEQVMSRGNGSGGWDVKHVWVDVDEDGVWL